MILPRQSAPVSRTLAGDYVPRAGGTVWVPWRNLTPAERERLWKRVLLGQQNGGVAASGGC